MALLLWDSARHWGCGSARDQCEEAAIFLLTEHNVWPAKFLDADVLRLEDVDGRPLGTEYLGNGPEEGVRTSVDWARVTELPAMDEPPVYASNSEWAVLGVAATLAASPWSVMLGSVDATTTQLMHAALAWARGGEIAADKVPRR
ncbi:hypothetical protein ABZ128_28845 [Streptomyces sp. NPDC006326]|uniref:hypothetical protein n=1 Tax=Streptomyces sp. NPDC006326 TaxID=3156752 RepID=UPI0033A90870